MKKFYSLLATVAMVATVSAQDFTATYSFDGTPVAKTASVTGTGNSDVTIGAFSATSIVEVTTTGNRYATNNHSTSSTLATGKYYSVTITPKAAYRLVLDKISVKFQRSNSGPAAVAIRTSEDSYASNLVLATVGTGATSSGNALIFNADNSANTISGNEFTLNITKTTTTPVTIRIYPYNSGNGSTGTFSIDDVVITGSSTYDETLAVGDATKAKANLVKNTIVSNELIFGAAAKVSVYNTAGQVVKTAEVAENSRLDVSALPKGTYVVTGLVNGQAVSQKVIKK